MFQHEDILKFFVLASAQKIEHMKKMVRIHWVVLDFDKSFFSAATDIEFDENSEISSLLYIRKLHY